MKTIITELLKALKSACEEMGMDDTEWWDDAQTAIAKAETFMAETADAPPEVTDEVMQAAYDAWVKWIKAGRGTGFSSVKIALQAALAVAQVDEMNIERLREALIAHEKKVVDMVLSCQKDPKDVHLTSTEVLESRYALLAALKDTTNVPPKRGKHTNTKEREEEILDELKKAEERDDKLSNTPPKRGKHTNTSDGYCEICRPAKK